MSLLELSGRAIKNGNIPYDDATLPPELIEYLDSARTCTGVNCGGVYFTSRVKSIKVVDFCGKYRVPMMEYLCSAKQQCIVVPVAAASGGGGGGGSTGSGHGSIGEAVGGVVDGEASAGNKWRTVLSRKRPALSLSRAKRVSATKMQKVLLSGVDENGAVIGGGGGGSEPSSAVMSPSSAGDGGGPAH